MCQIEMHFVSKPVVLWPAAGNNNMVYLVYNFNYKFHGIIRPHFLKPVASYNNKLCFIASWIEFTIEIISFMAF